MKTILPLITLFCSTLLACNAQQKIVNTTTNETPIAFPKAEGFGKFATGGRGGKIVLVTNLNDDGEGSFRKAATQKEPRIIVFTVDGTIHLQSPLSVKGNVTIAGQTSPGDGICIADYPVSISGDNVIIQYVRFRLGDKNQNKGKVAGSGHDDALSVSKRKHIIIDHCSVSWSTDEAFSIYNGDSSTVQWNIISEPLNYSYHFEKGDTDFEQHGFGGIWGGTHLTAHHNLFAHCKNRTPRFNGIRQGGTELVDFVNNVIYNWGINNIYAGEGGNYNLVNNYYKYGSNTEEKVKYRIANPGRTDSIYYGKWYINGNYIDGAKDVTKDNYQGITLGQKPTDVDIDNCLISKPHPTIALNITNAKIGFEDVLKFVGCSFKRDSVDTRIINEVINRKGKIIDVQGGYASGTAYETSKNAWPMLQTKVPKQDTDKDGIPDEWEISHKLNPNNAADATLITLHKFYTNIELYIHSITQ